MTEERENEVTQIAVHTTVIISMLRVEWSRQNDSLVASVLSEDHERAKSLKFQRDVCGVLERGRSWWT